MLNPRQEKFCLEYIRTGNATQSAITAGYSSKGAEVTGFNLLRNTKILQRKNELTALTTTLGVADITERKEKLSLIMRKESREPVTAKEQVQAISELNKMTGDYAPEKHAVAHKVIFEVVYRDGQSVTTAEDEG